MTDRVLYSNRAGFYLNSMRLSTKDRALQSVPRDSSSNCSALGRIYASSGRQHAGLRPSWKRSEVEILSSESRYAIFRDFFCALRGRRRGFFASLHLSARRRPRFKRS